MSVFSKLCERGQRIAQWLENTPPILILSGLAFLGICLTLVSTTIHLDSVYFAAIGKKLGYLNEINWSVNFSFVVPVCFGNVFAHEAFNAVLVFGSKLKVVLHFSG